MHRRAFLTAVAPFLLLSLPLPAGAEAHRADVVVYGGTAGGVVAAVAAAREGKSVLLLEPGKHLGGMASGGLGATDAGNRGAVGGYSREFFDRIHAYYVKKYGPASAQVKDCSGGFRFEPHVAETLFGELLREAEVPIRFGTRVDRVNKEGARITSIRTLEGDTFAAKVFIDASYEGDLMARAGVPYAVGREGREEYGEPLAGVQEYSKFHQWPVKVSAYGPDKKLLPFVQPGPPGKPGQGDKKVQAYNFRICMTQVKENQVPFPKPRGYDPARYELLARYLAKRPDVKVGQLMHPVPMPNGKTDTNNNGPFSTDHIGASWDYPDADYEARARIWQDHVEYVQGFYYFLSNDERVPPALQKEMRSWGLAKDEFTDTDNWPHQLYIREARRMRGAYVVTQHDITDKREKEDSVGLGSYNMDSHHVQRVATEDGSALNEGDFQVGIRPYAIPYRSLTPEAADCDNLLVPVCVSASHVAYGTIRMEPVFMILGQAAGVAAALAIDDGVAVQKVPADGLRKKLVAQKAILSPAEVPGRAVGVRQIDPKKLAGVVVDDEDARETGPWRSSASVGPVVGTGYLHDNNADKGKMRVRFTPKLEAGRYEVRLFYTPHDNRATNALVVIRHAEGEAEVRVNQRRPLKGEEGHPLGTFRFAGEGWVEVRNDGSDGHVIADAVQFLPAKE